VAIVVLDASALIAFLDARDADHAGAVGALQRHERASLVLPASAYAEVLVGPLRRQPAAVAMIEDLLRILAIRVEPLTSDIARRAAALRARHVPLGLPDAFVLATAEILDAAAVVTADRAWTKISRRVQTI
jgi:PIN domain nuclease of toxin-antitoxin system